MNSARGSLWRRWDLHVHTPASYDYKNMGVTNEEVVGALRDHNISLAAITDHYRIDTERIEKLRSLASSDITILPGIEFRSELGGRTSVHFCGIFSEEWDLVELWTKIQGGLDLTYGDIQKRGGYERLVSGFADTAKFIHGLGGVVTVHAGTKSNSFESIPSAEKFKQALKTGLAKTSIDIMELGKPSDQQSYSDIVFPSIGIIRPLVICSDNHDARNYALKELCWIKADTTFRGLAQVIREPQRRCFIGKRPGKLEIVQTKPRKFIDKVFVCRDTSVTGLGNEKWFDCDIPLNHDLIAIIGNKGSGKSALADIVGLLGNTRNSEFFSFLCGDKFRSSRTNKAKHFRAALMWKDATAAIEKRLDEEIAPSSVQMVRYIPQGFLEKICTDVEASDFTRELETAIFSHIPDDQRLGYSTLESLIEYHSQGIEEAIGAAKATIHRLNVEILQLRQQLSPEYKSALEAQLIEKQKELAAHDQAKPGPVPRPTELPPDSQKRMRTVLTRLEMVQKYIEDLQSKIQSNAELRQEVQRKLADLGQCKERLQNLSSRVNELRGEIQPAFDAVGLSFDDVVAFRVDYCAIDAHMGKLSAQQMALRNELDGSRRGTLQNRLDRAGILEQELQAQLDEPNRRYQEYADNLSAWDEQRALIVGSSSEPDTVEYLKRDLRELSSLPDRLRAREQKRIEVTRHIYGKKRELLGKYEALYLPVQEFIDTHQLIQKELSLQFSVSVRESGFSSRFFSFVTHGVSGSFCGQEQGEERLDQLLERTDFNDEDSVVELLNSVVRHLTHDMRRDRPEPVEIESQLRRTPGSSAAALFDFLFSLDYLEPVYSLRKGEKGLEQISPGERGELLLIFYLLIDQDDKPLVIDQPEENLDNQTVYSCLVRCIQEAKRRRQVIIVTHNPNLAVVCDAEQVIYCSHDRVGDRSITYTSGSIENPVMNKHILDVLEGTRPAFENREGKYFKS